MGLRRFIAALLDISSETECFIGFLNAIVLWILVRCNDRRSRASFFSRSFVLYATGCWSSCEMLFHFYVSLCF